LVNQINDFKNGVEKLEKNNSQLKGTKIKMDLTEYKSIIETHLQQKVSQLNALKSFENRFDSKIKQAKIHPTWRVLFLLLVCCLGWLQFRLYYLKNSDKVYFFNLYFA